MTTPIPGPLLFTAIITATKVTVIPVTNTGLIATTGTDDGGGPCCTFPTVVKPDPRTATEAAADRLLTRDLGCLYGVLRLVALYEPEPGHPHREAVYTSVVWWPGGQPTQDGDAGLGDDADGVRCRLVTIACRDDADRHRLQLGRLAGLIHGADLAAAARALPDLTSPRLDHTHRARSRRRDTTAAAPVAPPDSPARRFR